MPLAAHRGHHQLHQVRDGRDGARGVLPREEGARGAGTALSEASDSVDSRLKSLEEAPKNDIANKIGGGGLAYAAGAVVNGILPDVISEVVDLATTSVERKMKGN